MFYVGQKVVCVDNSPTSKGYPCRLTKGAIYTINAYLGVDIESDDGYSLVEVDEPPYPGHRRGFKGKRFRPVVERKTDISSLERLLVPGAKILETAP